jgi:hypothetical protein
VALPLEIANPWFPGEVDIPTFSLEEMLATKLRALLQRNKGRDLFDLAHSLEIFDSLRVDRIVDMFGRYLGLSGQTITRAQAQERMLAKLANPRFLLDVRPLLPAAQVEALTEESTADSFRQVFTILVDQLPGEPWARTSAVKERFGISW